MGSRISIKEVFDFLSKVCMSDDRECENKTLEDIMDEVELTYSVSLDQSNLFTPEHRKYNYEIWHNGISFQGEFQFNPRVFNVECDSMKRGILQSMINDADAFLHAESTGIFAWNYGHDGDEAREIYDECRCRRIHRAINRMFALQEIETLRENLSYFDTAGYMERYRQSVDKFKQITGIEV